jgi:CHAT domain-containing protein
MAGAIETDWVPLRMLLEQAAHLPRRRRRRFLRGTEAEALEALQALRRVIWDPLHLEPGEVLLIPTGDLHGMPLEALPFAGDPSQPVWVPSRWPHPALIGKRPRVIRKNALLLHDRSPGTQLETDRVGSILRRGGLQVRTASNRAPFEKNPDRLGVLHVAAHGSYHRDHWILNGIRLNDGWLGFEQLRRPETRDSLMYFGSCESGLTSELPGSEMGGWMSAGLGAGARELVLSLWKIDDESALAFAEAFYPLWCRGVPVNLAAQRARGAVYARSPHPFSWAPFLAVG